jgi:hypothetical protein
MPGRMKFVIPAVLVVVLLAEVAAGQKAQPGPVAPSIAAKTEEMPTPSGTPEPQGVPDLLPESNQLPAQSPNLRLPSPSTLKSDGSESPSKPDMAKQLSPEEQVRNRSRLAEIKALAMRNPRVIDLLKEADGALSAEAKRQFTRAYYHTLCTRMRYLDPTLDQTITAFERAQIRRLAVGPSHISIVSRDLLPRERARRARP